MRMEARLEGLPHIRVAAVDGANIPGTELLSGPAIGCSMSHVKAWEMLIDSGDEFACILEDDVILSINFHAMISDEGWLPADFDVVKFESMNRNVEIGERRDIPHGHGIARLCSPHMGSGGYIISSDAAKRLMARALSLSDTIDGVLFGKQTVAFMRIFQVFPALCIQEQYVHGHNRDSSISPDGGKSFRREKPQGWEKIKRELSRPFTAAFYATHINKIMRRSMIFVEPPKF